MSTTWIFIAFLLGLLIVFQIAKASEYVAILKGEEKTRRETNRINAFLLLIFLIAGMIGVVYCNEQLRHKILGPSASIQGEKIDTMIWITLGVTFVVFVITQILLFWFAFKYQEKPGRKALYFPHDNRLEIIWTAVPAVVLTVLVGFGLYYWYQITGEAPDDAQVVEVTGSQFKWEFRYPGNDGKLGKRNYKLIDEQGSNPLGQDWNDNFGHDDILASQTVHLVVGKPVKFIIGSKDVIHDVGLAHFRMKMDAVPGMPTTMWFTPKYTTAYMKEKYGHDFEYEISCDQMCGKGHFGMRGTIVVETQQEFDKWMSQQKPQYAAAHPAPEAAPAAGQPASDSTGAKKPADSTGRTAMLNTKNK